MVGGNCPDYDGGEPAPNEMELVPVGEVERMRAEIARWQQSSHEWAQLAREDRAQLEAVIERLRGELDAEIKRANGAEHDCHSFRLLLESHEEVKAAQLAEIARLRGELALEEMNCTRLADAFSAESERAENAERELAAMKAELNVERHELDQAQAVLIRIVIDPRGHDEPGEGNPRRAAWEFSQWARGACGLLL
jgi:chromosome segregation ATPase